MPEGPLGFPRLTDMGPLVSSHREDSSKCSIDICYNGRSKEEVFRELINTFLDNKRELAEDLEDAGVPVEDIVVGGSVAKGDFGCRELKKALRELQEVSEVNEDIQVVLFNAENDPNKEGIRGLVEAAKEEFEEGSIAYEDTLIAVCSDLDVFVITDTNIYRKKQHTREVQMAHDNFISSFDSDINIFPIINESETVYNPVISTRDDMEKILRRYY